jgi:type III secretion system (T3SS) SseB-like protein
MPFIADNELERALVKAVKNPGAAPDFYRLLLESDLLVLGTAQGQEDASQPFSLPAGGKLNLVTGLKDGAQYLPVFSSLARMQDYVKQESRYLSINGRALLEMTSGAPVILNPSSEFGKEFTAQQVAQLLNPVQAPAQPRTIVGEADYPLPLVEALTRVFTAHPAVEAAWMIQVTFADRAKEPHPLVGIETGDVAGFAQLVQAIQEETERADIGMVFDIQRIDRNVSTSLTDALLQVPPFYTRGARQKFN